MKSDLIYCNVQRETTLVFHRGNNGRLIVQNPQVGDLDPSRVNHDSEF